MAVTASEELKAFFRGEGVDGVFCIAGASGWGNLAQSDPHVGIHLPEGAEFDAMKEKVSELAVAIEKRGIRVAIYPYDKSYGR